MHYRLAGLRGKWGVRKSVAGIALLAVLATLVLAGSAFGVSLHVEDIALKEVIKVLTQQSGVNIVIVDDSKLEKKVTAKFDDVSLEKALDHVVKGAGIPYRRAEDGTIIIGGTADEAAVLSQGEVAPVLSPVEQESVAPRKKTVITTIKLQNSRPSELLQLLISNGANPMPSYAPAMPDRSRAPQITNPGGGIYNLTPSGNVLTPSERAVNMRNNQPVAPTYDPRGYDVGANRTADPYTGSGQVPRPGIPSYGVPGGGITGTANPANPRTTTGGSGGSSGNFLWPEGVEQAQPFDLDNSIIVKGEEDAIAEFKRIVRMLDIPPKQVEIKAEFIEVKVNDVKAFGIDWNLQRLQESFETQFNPIGNVVVGFASGNLTAQLRAQLTQDRGRVINSPIISTINNQPANISISNSIPYWVSINTIVGDQIIQQSTPNFIDINTELWVMPRVNGDGTITMILSPQVSDTGNIVVGPDGTSIPEQRQQALSTQRRVMNGETIVVGGFIRKNDSTSINKIPILGDLPIIGSLFRTTAKTTEDRELLIFITPRIIPDASGGTVGSSPSL